MEEKGRSRQTEVVGLYEVHRSDVPSEDAHGLDHSRVHQRVDQG